MEDSLLDMSQDELTIKETQLGDSPATFSRNLVDRFKIIGHNTQTGSETVNPTDNNMTNDEGNPSTSDVVSSRDKAIEAIEHHLTVPLRQTLRDKSRASAKCDFLRICLARNSFPKGVTLKVPLKVQDAPAVLQRKWNDILQECSKQLTLQLVQFHQEQIVQFEQRAESIITDASHHLLPEYITNVPNIPNMIESTIEELLCEISLLNRNLKKRPSPPSNKTPQQKRSKNNPPGIKRSSISTTSSNIASSSSSTNPTAPPSVPAPITNTKNNPKNGVSSKGKDINRQHPWRPLKLKKRK